MSQSPAASFFISNGVVDKGILRCEPTMDLSNYPAPLTQDFCPGAGKTGKCCLLRPNNLVRHGFQNSFTGSDVTDGSLPSSPEEAEPSTFPSPDALENDTRDLIEACLRRYAGLPNCRCSQRAALKTMCDVVGQLAVKHEIAYKGMINKLKVEEQPGDLTVVSSIAKELFSDGKTNWGRIASLVAFGALLSKHLREKGHGDSVSLVAHEISSYLLSDQLNWLIKNNKWEGFVQFFHIEDPETTVRTALMKIVGVVGIGAGLAFLLK
ncbi:induced myeloid leukemia cell differentiation protein Mcl-1b [Denticeps clupeoides]|uniref:induced myeloid leukemia cell differentiation protein Mcl-1b n=1 Tax=Denticeps clupeoides TaxID=299321 RepID=UPI0010A3AE32|nr:induced myeloid leukemia cell differentiation protein Mcl-1 homolog [Denticeps clupeoides]